MNEYKLNQDKLLRDKKSLMENHQKVLTQLRTLFAAYNELKANLEKTKDKLNYNENEVSRLQSTLNETSRENETLRLELERMKKMYNDDVERFKSEIKRISVENTESAFSNKNREEERERYKRCEQELREENLRLQKRINDYEVTLDAKTNQHRSELHKIMEEKDRLAYELEEWHGKCDGLNRDIEDQKEEQRRLRKEITDLTFTNDELQERVAYYQRKYKNVVNEYEDELARKQNEEGALKSDLTLKKLMEIEEKLSNINIVHPEKDVSEDSKQGGTDTEKLLEGDSENFEKNLANYQLQKGKGNNLLKKLTRKILQKEELKNAHVQNLFKLNEIDLKDKENEYKNLLKAMGALYYANRSVRLMAELFDHWKTVTAEALEQIEEQPCEESQKGKPIKPGIEINTELTNKEALDNEALLNELQINTNKEPSNVEDNAMLIHRKEKPEQAIRIDDEYKDNYEGDKDNSEQDKEDSKENDVGQEAKDNYDEGFEYDEEPKKEETTSEQVTHSKPEAKEIELKSESSESKSKSLKKSSTKAEPKRNIVSEVKKQNLVEDIKELPGFKVQARSNLEIITESKSKPKKVQLKDIDQEELNNLLAQLREHIIEELRTESKKETESPEKVTKIEFRGNATEIYYKLIKGITDYFFNIFCQAVKYSKTKNV